LSRAMDDMSDTVSALTAKVEEQTAEIKDKEAQIAAINQELKETKDLRDKEHAEYLEAKSDDEEAAEIVDNAKGVLETFYKENELMLAQFKQPFTSTAGEAPPPPPKTWEGSYGGKTDESTGVIFILMMIHEDILKDVTKGKQEEADSLALYTKSKTNLETNRDELNTAIDALTTSRGTANQDIESNKNDRGLKNQELKTVLKRIEDANPNCDFITINYAVRRENRHIEIDGLEKAKQILAGGKFDGLPDPDREMVPNDAAALVQNRRDRRKFLGRES